MKAKATNGTAGGEAGKAGPTPRECRERAAETRRKVERMTRAGRQDYILAKSQDDWSPPTRAARSDQLKLAMAVVADFVAAYLPGANYACLYVGYKDRYPGTSIRFAVPAGG